MDGSVGVISEMPGLMWVLTEVLTDPVLEATFVVGLVLLEGHQL